MGWIWLLQMSDEFGLFVKFGCEQNSKHYRFETETEKHKTNFVQICKTLFQRTEENWRQTSKVSPGKLKDFWGKQVVLPDLASNLMTLDRRHKEKYISKFRQI